MTPETPTTSRDDADSEPPSTPGAPRVRAECYVRAATPSSAVYESLDRLQSLDGEGQIDDLDVRAWPAAVEMTDHFADSDVLETFERFEDWASQWNVAVRPPFAVEDRTSELADRETRVLVTPSLCLAVYAEGALAGVFPHSTDDAVVRVDDAIDAIAAGEVVANGAERMPADPPAEREACPVCGSHLVNGQGLYHCPDCDRTVVATPGGQYARSPASGPEADPVDLPSPPAE